MGTSETSWEDRAAAEGGGGFGLPPCLTLSLSVLEEEERSVEPRSSSIPEWAEARAASSDAGVAEPMPAASVVQHHPASSTFYLSVGIFLVMNHQYVSEFLQYPSNLMN